MSKIILITGASSGIGYETAKIFITNGWRVILVARRTSKLQDILNEFSQYKDHIKLISVNVSNKQKLKTEFQNLPIDWQQVDVCFCNAGLAHGRDPFQNNIESEWEEMVQTNINGVLYTTQLVLPSMIERKKGYIITMGSTAARWQYEGGAVYGATKAAIDLFSQGLRIDLLKYGIKVSVLHAGAVETEFSKVRFKNDMEKFHNVYKGLTPLYGQDIADIIWYLCNMPKNVVINDMVITPLAQANNYYFNRI
ncbi:MAG: SDR family NAD(P)-dependent oxidoreductase [Sediminibacterium sp.]|nr:SDR family NAD(P)-dependent oxidoreductase [Sediminibacterium sp.]